MTVPAVSGGFAASLTATELADLTTSGRQRRFPKREHLFSEGDRSDWVAVVLEGRVQNVTLTDDGRRLDLSRSLPGDLLGEMAAIDGLPRSGTAIAMDTVEVLAVPAPAFRDWLLDHPRVALLLLETIVAKVRASDRRRIEFVARDALSRVSQRLVELAADGAPADPTDGSITVAVSQDELATWVGASREAVSKAMARLRRAGVITTGRRAVVVVDLESLRRLAR
jgi:CRP-like cAMP-binding protein